LVRTRTIGVRAANQPMAVVDHACDDGTAAMPAETGPLVARGPGMSSAAVRGQPTKRSGTARVLAVIVAVMRWLCGLRRRTLVVDGFTWTYLDSGGSNLPVLLLIHGFGADKDTWLPYGRLLRRRFRVIAPDLPGFGESVQDPAMDYSANAQVDRLHRFIGALGLDRVHIAGNSLGGYLSGWYALEHPDTLHSVMFIDAAGMPGSNRSEADLAIERGDNPFAINDFQAFEKALSMVAHKPPKLPMFVKKVLYREMLSRKEYLDVLFWRLLQDLKSRSLLDQLHRVRVPALVLWGREDHLVDVSSAVAIHERIKDSTLVILDDVGHVPMFEAPRVTATHHLQFIDALDRAARDQPGRESYDGEPGQRLA
jgi:pimeloyl-ACP methyl ester carboxylesterase